MEPTAAMAVGAPTACRNFRRMLSSGKSARMTACSTTLEVRSSWRCRDRRCACAAWCSASELCSPQLQRRRVAESNGFEKIDMMAGLLLGCVPNLKQIPCQILHPKKLGSPRGKLCVMTVNTRGHAPRSWHRVRAQAHQKILRCTENERVTCAHHFVSLIFATLFIFILYI